MSYAALRERGPIQWPCTEEAPGGTERLYTDGVFNTDPDYREEYGRDLKTGAMLSATEARAQAPAGRAHLLGAEYQPMPEQPDDAHPLLLTTGRTVYHFHTRTKTGRAPELQAAAPDVWAELSAADAAELGIRDGDPIAISSARGELHAPARITGIRPGVVFVPFHYGYWDSDGDAPDRAANELTLTTWDPVSKQPLYKVAAVAVTRAG
jgi:predicted molibdopterin-dependent oxidoreductase YjgC